MNRDDTDSILYTYGLAQVLTHQDDPQLWAAALSKYWPAPEAPIINMWGYTLEWNVSSLRFGIGRPKHSSTVEIEVAEAWCFERTDATHLQVKKCQENKPVDFDNPWYYLDVTRPSKGQNQALVHFGNSHGGLAGHGITYQWKRQEDGVWVEEKAISEWLS